MSASFPDIRPLRRSHGFTLIELMLVLLLMGIVGAAISLGAAPRPDEMLRRDARELALRLMAAQHAVRLDGRVIAWQALGDGYRFTRGSWVQVPGSVVPALSTAGALDQFEGDDMLRPRHWRAGEVEVQPAQPLLLTSEWIGSPLRLELHSEGHTQVIERDASGAFVRP